MGSIAEKFKRVGFLIPDVDKRDIIDLARELDNIQGMALQGAAGSSGPIVVPGPFPSNPKYFRLSGETQDAYHWQNKGYFQYSDNGNTLVTQIDNAGYIFNEQGGDIDFRIEGDTEANLFFVDASTDRIGIGTASPDFELELESGKPTLTVKATSTTGTTIGNKDNRLLFLADSATVGTGGEVVWAATDDSPTERWAAITGHIIQNNADGAKGHLRFATKTGHTDEALTTRMTIDNAGYVGIGTTEPTSKLHVFSPDAPDSWNSAQPLVEITNLDTNASDSDALLVRGGANNAASGVFVVQDYSGNTDFWIGGTGNVGIKNANPGQALDVTGNIAVSGYTDIAEIADPAASASNVVRLFAHEKHIISLNEDDVWRDLSASAHGKSSYIHTEITISDQNGLNIQWGAGSIFDALITGGNQIVTIAAQTNNQAMTANSMNYFYFDKSAGNIAYTIDPDNDIDWEGGDFTIGLVETTHNDVIEIDQFPVGNKELHTVREIIDEAFHTIVHRGLLVSEHSADLTWDIDQTAGAFTHGGLDHHHVSSRSAPTMRRWFHNAGNTWESDTNAEIDAANWDDDDDSAGITGNDNSKWYRSTFYTDADTTHWVYPQVEYANINAALMGIDPTPPHVLEHLPKTVTVIMRGNAAAFPAVGSDQWIDVRSILGATGAGVITDHGNLAGLDTGADHSYIDQSVVIAASPTFGGLTLNGSVSLDGDLNFQGPQTISTSSGTLYLLGALSITMGNNNAPLQWKDTGAVSRSVINYNASNVLEFTNSQGGIDINPTGGPTRFNTGFSDIDLRYTGTTTTNLFYIDSGANRVAVGVSVPAGRFHVDQSSDSAAIPVIVLDQADISEGTINFIASDRGVITGATNSLKSVRVELGGVVYRLALYVDA